VAQPGWSVRRDDEEFLRTDHPGRFASEWELFVDVAATPPSQGGEKPNTYFLIVKTANLQSRAEACVLP
jgi:hypothetical protein